MFNFNLIIWINL